MAGRGVGTRLLVVAASLLACLLVFTPVRAVAQGQDDESLDDLGDIPRLGRKALFQTQKYRDEGNWAESVRILQQTLAEHPDQDHFLLRFHLAVSLDQAGHSQEALQQYQESVRLEPRFAQGWLNLGELAYEQEQYTLAGRAFHQGFLQQEGDPPNIELLYYAASCYMMAADHAQAASILEDLVSGRYGQPQLEWFRALVASCITLADGGRGRSAVAKTLGHFPSDPEAWYLAFQFAASQDDYRQASVALTVVGYLRPLTAGESITLGDLYSAVGVPAIASRYYEQGLGEDATAAEYERLASAYLAAFKTEESLRILKLALQKQPTVRLWSLLGDQHYIDENYAEAYRAYGECIELDPGYGRGYLMMGYCALELGNLADAIDRLESARRFPEQAKTATALLTRARQLAADR